jgi:hypothetical protein
MDDHIINSVSSQIYRQFPEVQGSRPKVKSLTTTQSLLIFEGNAKTADGKQISRAVRVVVDQNGKIVKVTTSR